MFKEMVVVFKDKKSREIQTFVNIEGHGARLELSQFMSLVAENYGSPVSTITRKGLLDGLLTAAQKATHQMKSKTREVAAVNLEAEKKG